MLLFFALIPLLTLGPGDIIAIITTTILFRTLFRTKPQPIPPMFLLLMVEAIKKGVKQKQTIWLQITSLVMFGVVLAVLRALDMAPPPTVTLALLVGT